MKILTGSSVMHKKTGKRGVVLSNRLRSDGQRVYVVNYGRCRCCVFEENLFVISDVTNKKKTPSFDRLLSPAEVLEIHKRMCDPAQKNHENYLDYLDEINKDIFMNKQGNAILLTVLNYGNCLLLKTDGGCVP